MKYLTLVTILIALVLGTRVAAQAGSGVIVNGQPISEAAVHALQQVYRTTVPDGRYWYDPVSGLWGLEGGPGIGQIAPGMKLGGRLSARASGSRTGVFVNGREIHYSELAYLQRLYGSVRPGRYWLDHRGIAGFEGGPPRFNLRAAASGGNAYNRNTHGGSLMSDGNCSGYLHPDGATVLSGNC